MPKRSNRPRIALPKGWPERIRSALLHVVSLAQYAAVYTRSWAAQSTHARVRLKATVDRLEQEVALLREELRIQHARWTRIPAPRRPHYTPIERMAILELRAARGWKVEQVAHAFLVTPATVASWMKRLDEQGPDALVQIHGPVNKFPDFVRYAVGRLKVLCPAMGKVKIAQTLARAGLHLAPTTVGRMLKERPPAAPAQAAAAEARRVTAQHPNHVWHVDLTTVPTGAGFWCSWLPWALPQCWPFCWWVAVVIDHLSRRAMGFSAFRREPDAAAVRCWLGRTIRTAGAIPKYLISDKGKQFWPCAAYRSWCRRRRIRPRFGAVGQQGSIAVVERFIRTMKDEGTRRLLVPLRRDGVCRELGHFVHWYNAHRPNMGLEGRTPDEVYRALRPAHTRPRLEPRGRWPRRCPCAQPRTLVAGQPGARFTLEVDYHAGRRHLPIVSLHRAA